MSTGHGRFIVVAASENGARFLGVYGKKHLLRERHLISDVENINSVLRDLARKRADLEHNKHRICFHICTWAN